MIVRQTVEVEVEVDPADLKTGELLSELYNRDVPRELLDPIKDYIKSNKVLTRKDLIRWVEGEPIYV